MIAFAKMSLLILGVLVCAGGLVGFLKAQSKASLISGIVSAVLLVTAHSISNRNAHWGFVMGAVVCALLIVVFAIRLKKTGKFMPSGLMLILSVLEIGVLGVAIGQT